MTLRVNTNVAALNAHRNVQKVAVARGEMGAFRTSPLESNLTDANQYSS